MSTSNQSRRGGGAVSPAGPPSIHCLFCFSHTVKSLCNLGQKSSSRSRHSCFQQGCCGKCYLRVLTLPHLLPSPCSSLMSSRFSERPCLKNEVGCASLWLPHGFVHTSTAPQHTGAKRDITDIFLKRRCQGWRDGSVGDSCRGPGFTFQHPHGGTQLSVIPVLGDSMPPSGLHGYQARRWGTHIHVPNTQTHKIF